MHGLVLSLLLLTSVPAAPAPEAPPATRVPPGRHVLVNGSFAPGEWADAAAVPLDSGHVLRVKQDAEYLYLAIEFLQQKHTGLELFLGSAAGPPHAFHVSSALGSRTWGPEGWSEMAWQAEHWGANVIGTISGDGKMKLLEPNGFEIQLTKSQLRGGELAVRIELKRPAAVFPAGSRDDDPKGWLRLLL
jgi:hypothetical protein